MNFVKHLKRVGHDVHTGQNIEIYLGVLISAIIAFLSALNITNQTITLSVLLGAVALVTSSMLVNRRQNDEIKDVLTNLKDTRSLATRFFHKEDDITEIIQIIRSSQQVVLWGYTLKTHIPILEEVIEKELKRGLQLKILLIDPEGIALEMAAFRSRGDNQQLKVDQRKNLENNLCALKKIKDNWPGENFEYRVIDYFAPYTMYIYDPHQYSSGKMMVRLSTLEVPNDLRPTYYLTKEDDKDWFEFHVSQFEIAWYRAKNWVTKE